MSKGPNGEEPAPASVAELSDDDVAKVKAMGAKAAIVMHYGGNDWANAQIAGLKSEFSRLGVDVIATTDANFKPDKQVSDLETVMTQKPNIVVSIPHRPGRHRVRVQEGSGGRSEARLHGQRPPGAHSR